MDKNTPTVWS